jgi:hypothetical protein
MSQGAQEASATAEPVPAFWQAPWEFAVHALVGLFIFGLIAAPALGANIVISALVDRGADLVIVFGLKGMAYALFATDLVLFGVFIWRAACRAIKRL